MHLKISNNFFCGWCNFLHIISFSVACNVVSNLQLETSNDWGDRPLFDVNFNFDENSSSTSTSSIYYFF